MKELFHYLNSGCFIIQETVIQHPEMSRLNASSLNTIRIDTYNSFNEPPKVISALFRMGRSGSAVDNAMSGGIFVGIDMETGKLRSNAFAKLEHGGIVYSKHPDSGVPFKDFTIPYFSEVKEMACQAASSLADKLVGWDIGISAEGPVLIEGNGH
ncbi:MAG TPA: sugar-transfer associated ATP-grasp domain-containing protein, partial [Atribacterota bacterium]|nr:sugar-transfer associated ATP-grasp domain-containing protein [Atribacterota bacterium]